MIQALIVAVAVGAAAFYAFFQLAPRGLRARAAALVLDGARRAGFSAAARARLERRLVPAEACGGCSNCGPDEGKAVAAPAAAAPTPAARPLLFVRDPGKAETTRPR